MASKDTLTRGVTSKHWLPWMLQGYQSNYGIHGYSDKGRRPVYISNHGWSRDTRVTMASTDTLTRGGD